MSHHLLIAHDLGFRYRQNGVFALQSVDFTLHHGESVALIGANGAGKSTLLRIFSGLLEATEGYAQVGDVRVMKSTLNEIRRSIGFIFQNAGDQLFMPSVLEDVAFGLVNKGIPAEEAEKAAIAMLEELDSAYLADAHPSMLSGGEQTRAALAGVLVMHPDILLMDEPARGLDPRARNDLIGILKGFEHTRLIATHDLDLAWDVCDRILILHRGTLAADADRSILKDRRTLQDYGLDLPLRFRD